MEIFGYIAYIAVKCLAYVLWCYLGLRALDPGRERPMRRAVGLGIGRLILGIVVGLFIFFAALSMNNATRNAPLTYFSIYVPVRVAEWGVMHLFVSRRFVWSRS